MFRSKVITPMTILEALKYALIAIGGILFVIVVILIIHNHHKVCYLNLFNKILSVIIIILFYRQIQKVRLFQQSLLMNRHHYLFEMKFDD
jgi:hypothetical protein